MLEIVVGSCLRLRRYAPGASRRGECAPYGNKLSILLLLRCSIERERESSFRIFTSFFPLCPVFFYYFSFSFMLRKRESSCRSGRTDGKK